MLEPQQVAEYLEQLTDDDASTRRWAAEALGDGDEKALYPLIKALRDVNPGVQDAARRSLIAIGGEVTAYMTLPLLREDAYMRNTSRIILKQIGVPAVPLFRVLLKDKDDDIRIFALDLIAEIQHCDYPEDIEALLSRDPNPNARSAAARALSRVGGSHAAVVLRAALADEEWVCIAALEGLAERGDIGSVPAISGLLSHSSESVRYSAIEALGQLAAEEGKSALLKALPTAGPIERTAIVKSLVQIGVTPHMVEAYEVLVELLKSDDWEEKAIAIRGLSSLRDPRAIPVLLDEAGALDRSEPDADDLVAIAMQGLAEFGCHSDLVAAISSQDTRHMGKVIAIDVLAGLGCVSVVPVLIELMRGDLREVRRASARALGELHEETATQQLRESIEDRDGHVRRAAASALGKLQDKAAFAPLLDHLGRERYRDVYEEVVKALIAIDEMDLCSRIEELDSVAREILGRHGRQESALLNLTEDSDRAVRLAALVGLGNVATEASVARLQLALKDDDAEVRRAAVVSLGTLQMGLDAVKELLSDEDIWVRMSAATALGHGGPCEEDGHDESDPWR